MAFRWLLEEVVLPRPWLVFVCSRSTFLTLRFLLQSQ